MDNRSLVCRYLIHNIKNRKEERNTDECQTDPIVYIGKTSYILLSTSLLTFKVYTVFGKTSSLIFNLTYFKIHTHKLAIDP